MMREEFSAYKQTIIVPIDGVDKTYELVPLSGRFYGKFLSVVKSMQKIMSKGKAEETPADDLLDSIDSETAVVLHELVLEMVCSSYDIVEPKERISVDRFVSKNLFSFIPALIEVNLPGTSKDKE